MDCSTKMLRRPRAMTTYWITTVLWLRVMATCSQSDSSWRDQSLIVPRHSEPDGGVEVGVEQHMIQVQEMATYRKRLASLSFSDAQRLTQIDLTQSDTHVTAQVGHPAYLKCAVQNLGDQLVSWARRRDWHILTSGRHVYTSDERFQILRPVEDREPTLRPSQPNVTEWILQIQFVQQRDGGFYICQVPTDLGLVSHQVQLEVLVPDVFILGPKDLNVERGTTLSLVCIVENSPIPPQFVFWYHNDKLLNYQPKRDGVSVETEYGSRTHSKLEVMNAHESDTGNYTCSTSSGKPYSIYVHVLAGDQAAAMSRKNSAAGSSQMILVHLLTFLHLCLIRISDR